MGRWPGGATDREGSAETPPFQQKHKAGGAHCGVLSEHRLRREKFPPARQQGFHVVRGLAMERREFGLGSCADDKAMLNSLHFLQSVSCLLEQ